MVSERLELTFMPEASLVFPGNLQYGKEAESQTAGCSWLCPLLHSILCLGTGHPRVVTYEDRERNSA